MKKTTRKKTTKAPGAVAVAVPVMTRRAILKQVDALGRDIDRLVKRLERQDAAIARLYGSKAQPVSSESRGR